MCSATVETRECRMNMHAVKDCRQSSQQSAVQALHVSFNIGKMADPAYLPTRRLQAPNSNLYTRRTRTRNPEIHSLDLEDFLSEKYLGL